ncbi:MAG: prolyl oligopeptidase family serine peptidase [Ilumatobacter sp.]|uniref:alpha/beta hydrolase family esterase n=1 Tax=Ilumatobacter sp. TaxID=1967498 RepID=UPI0032993289
MDRRGLTAVVVAAIVAVGCNGRSDAADGSSGPVGSVPATQVVGNGPSSSVGTPATTDGPADRAVGTTEPSCESVEPELTTASGRRVSFRADGLSGPAPTIVVLHGFTNTRVGIERVADLTESANVAGIAVAYPLGTPTPIGGFGWNSGARAFATTAGDDVAALADMLAVLEATGCVDRDRVVITGESNGGGMTLAALCDARLAGRFRSAVMVVPAVDDGVLDRCGTDVDTTATLVAVVGLLDELAVFEGGNGLLPQLEWFERVAMSRGCADVDVAVPVTGFVDRYRASGCDACTELIAVADGPHTWPGSTQSNGDLVPGTFDLNRRIIDDLLAPEPECLSER